MSGPRYGGLSAPRDVLTVRGSSSALYRRISFLALMMALMPPFGATTVAFAFTLFALSLTELIERPAYLKDLESLTLAWDQPTPTVLRGRSAPLSLTLRNPTRRHFESLCVWLRGPDGLLSPRAVTLPPGGSALLQYEVEGRRVGEWRLWGVELEWSPSLSLSSLRRRAPVEVCVRVDFGPAPLPAPLVRGSQITIGDASDRSPYQDEGDFQELRAYQPGDGQRRVAWRASARAGELLSRVYELPRRQRVLLAVDVGPQLRDPHARRPLDLALDAAARYLSACRDVPVGLALFDHRLLGVIPPALARPAPALSLLRSANQPSDLDCLDAAEGQLAELLSEALVWRGCLGEEERGWRDILAERLKKHAAELEALLPAGHLDPAGDPASPARLFALACSAERLPLPARKARAPEERAEGLAALTRLADTHGVSDLIILSRAEGLGRPALAPLAAWAGRGGALLWLEVGLSRDDAGGARASFEALAPLKSARGAVELGALWSWGRCGGGGGQGGREVAQPLCGVRVSCVS